MLNKFPMNLDFTTVTSHRLSKGEAAKHLYPYATTDCAVPQTWVDNMVARGFDDPAAHFVTCYFGNNPAVIMPVTQPGVLMAATVATYSA